MVEGAGEKGQRLRLAVSQRAGVQLSAPVLGEPQSPVTPPPGDLMPPFCPPK